MDGWKTMKFPVNDLFSGANLLLNFQGVPETKLASECFTPDKMDGVGRWEDDEVSFLGEGLVFSGANLLLVSGSVTFLPLKSYPMVGR